MADKNVFFLMRQTPKEEVPNIGIDHALGCLTVMEFEVEPAVAFTGDGILNLLKGQEGKETYGVESAEDRVKMLLMSDVPIIASKEDMDRLGITEDMFTDAKEFDIEETITPKSWDEIQKEMGDADFTMLF